VKVVRSNTANPAGGIKLNEPGSAKGSEFKRFQDLTAKLTQVPKSEVDAQRKA